MSKAVKGEMKRVLAVRLLPGMDVMDSIQEYCEEAGIKNGIILSMIGSLRNAQFMNPEPNKEAKMGYAYGDPIKLTGAIELVSGVGMICHNEKEEVMLHVHVALSDQKGNGYGGHLIPGNEVLMTVDIVIGEVEDINMIRTYDEQTGLAMFNPLPF